PELGGLDGGVAAAILLTERPIERLHRLFDLGRVRHHGGHPDEGSGDKETWPRLTTSTRPGVGPGVGKLLTQRSSGSDISARGAAPGEPVPDPAGSGTIDPAGVGHPQPGAPPRVA